MKIVLVNTFEASGGAAIACKRLMYALQKKGIDVKLIVRDKVSDNPNVITTNNSFIKRKINFIRFVWERLIIFICNKFSKKNLFAISLANTGTNISKLAVVKDADIIHMHWINQGFLSLKSISQLLKTNKPIVWTMHDMWPCTGICHHSWGCTNFHNKCGNCKFLAKPAENDCSNITWVKKNKIKLHTIKPVAVSEWLAEQVDNSPLFKNSTASIIPNVIDISLFSPKNKTELREQFKLPTDRKIILFSAAKIDDPIKGFSFFLDAVNLLYEREGLSDKIFIILLGQIKNNNDILLKIKYPYKYFGLVNDLDTVSLLFSLSDVVVNSSFYETFGQTLIEAMSSGSIPVTFDNSGTKDIIDHKINGYLAKYKSVEDLAEGIGWVLFESDYEQLTNNARQKAINYFSEDVIANQYIQLYNKILT